MDAFQASDYVAILKLKQDVSQVNFLRTTIVNYSIAMKLLHQLI